MGRLERDDSPAPRSLSAGDRAIARDRNRFREGLCFKECFIALRRAAPDPNGLTSRTRNLADLSSAKVKNQDLGFVSPNIRNKNWIARNKPLMNAGFSLWNKVNPLMVAVRLETQFHTPNVRCVAI